MIKQISSKEIKEYLKNNPKCVLLDVRTQEEWDTIGKPDGEKIGLKTYFMEIRRDALFDFVKEFKNLNIVQDKEILVICLIVIFFVFFGKLNKIKLYLYNLFDV